MKRLLFNSNQREIPSSPLRELQQMKKIATPKDFLLHPHKKCDIVKFNGGCSPIYMIFYSTKNSIVFQRSPTLLIIGTLINRTYARALIIVGILGILTKQYAIYSGEA